MPKLEARNDDAESGVQIVVVGNPIHDFSLGRFRPFPTQHFDPLVGFEVFVMLKKVGNGLQAHWAQVIGLLPACVKRQNLVNWHRQHFAVLASFIFHLQNANSATSHHHPGDQWLGRYHQHCVKSKKTRLQTHFTDLPFAGA